MAGCRVNCGLRVNLGLVVSHVVYGNELVQVVFVLTRSTGYIRVEFFQLVRVAGRVSVSIYFCNFEPQSDTNTTRRHDLPPLLTNIVFVKSAIIWRVK